MKAARSFVLRLACLYTVTCASVLAAEKTESAPAPNTRGSSSNPFEQAAQKSQPAGSPNPFEQAAQKSQVSGTPNPFERATPATPPAKASGALNPFEQPAQKSQAAGTPNPFEEAAVAARLEKSSREGLADTAEFFKNDDGRVSFKVRASAGGGFLIGEIGGGAGCPVKLGSKRAELDISSFLIRGQLWDLMGELVELYEARYTLGYRLRIPLTTDEFRGFLKDMPRREDGLAYCIIEQGFMGTHQAQAVERDGGLILTVSPDLFDQISIYSTFDMAINFQRNYGGCAVVKGYPGIVGRAGEWGWDVAGSPNWTNAFWSSGGAARITQKSVATNLWQSLKTEPHQVSAKVKDLSISLGDFTAALEAANPEVAAKWTQAMSGIPARALTARRGPESSLFAAMQALSRKLAGICGNKISAADRKQVAAELATLENKIESDSLSPEEKNAWERLIAVAKLGSTAIQDVQTHPAFENLGASQLHFRSEGIELAILPNSEEGEYLFKVRFNGSMTPSLDFRLLRAVTGNLGQWKKRGFPAQIGEYYDYPRITFTFAEEYAGFPAARAVIDQQYGNGEGQRIAKVTTFANGLTIELGTQSAEANQWLRQVFFALEAAFTERGEKPVRTGF